MASTASVIEAFCETFIEALQFATIPTNAKQHASLEAEHNERRFSISTAKRYAQLFAIMAIVHEHVRSNATIMQRDIYYMLKGIFLTHKDCTDRVLEVGRMLGLRRADMNIVASPRGFVCGTLSFAFGCDECLMLTEDDHICIEEPTPVTHHWITHSASSIYLAVPRECKYIIVVEKLGIFHRLCEDQFFRYYYKRIVPSIIVTGCGYPDTATKALVAKVSSLHPELTVVGLCDYNPHGLELLLTYRYRSERGAIECDGFQSPLRWLGLRKSHLAQFQTAVESVSRAKEELQTETKSQSKQICSNNSSDNSISLFRPFTKLDSSKIRKLRQIIAQSNDLPGDYLLEAIGMEEGRIKCELECFYSLGWHYLSKFIKESLETSDYI